MLAASCRAGQGPDSLPVSQAEQRRCHPCGPRLGAAQQSAQPCLAAGWEHTQQAQSTRPPHPVAGSTHRSSRYPPRMSWHTSVRGLRLLSGGWRWASGTVATLKSSLASGCQASSSSRPDKKKLTGSVVPVSKCRAAAGEKRGGGGQRWSAGPGWSHRHPRVPRPRHPRVPHLAGAAGGC